MLSMGMGKESHDIISLGPCFYNKMVKLGFNLSHNATCIEKIDGMREVALLAFHYHCIVLKKFSSKIWLCTK